MARQSWHCTYGCLNKLRVHCVFFEPVGAQLFFLAIPLLVDGVCFDVLRAWGEECCGPAFGVFFCECSLSLSPAEPREVEGSWPSLHDGNDAPRLSATPLRAELRFVTPLMFLHYSNYVTLLVYIFA